MHWLRLSNHWLLTMGSQGEAKCYTKEFNGSQEAKGRKIIFVRKRYY